ncbi:hypothetical protein ACU8L5_36055 (plasmid) [Rhizobium leguminosarum]
MTNIFLREPKLYTNLTAVRRVSVVGTDAAVVLDQNIVRPEGGGQPRDHGSVTVGDQVFPIGQVVKSEGETWLRLSGAGSAPPEEGELVSVSVDRERRATLSKSHSLTHLMMAAGKKCLEDFDSKGAAIDEAGQIVTISFRTSSVVDDIAINMIDAVVRHLVAKDAPVTFTTVKSLEEGAKRFPRWRVDSTLGLSGKIRVVDIAGIDANPCSGSHVETTGDVGPYRMFHDLVLDGDIYRFSAERTRTWMYWFGEEALIGFDWDGLHTRPNRPEGTPPHVR